MTTEDHCREAALAAFLRTFLTCTDPAERAELWHQFAALHRRRNPGRVAEMEREQGLDRG